MKKTMRVPALEKALDILEYVARRNSSVSVKELSRELEIATATAYRTVNYLSLRGYLRENDQSEGEYFLGPQIFHLANLVTQQLDLVHLAKPIMKELAVKTNQTTQLGILQDFGVVYVEQELPTSPVNIIAALRTIIPINVSASGKVLVAHLSTREQEYFLQNAELPKQTPNSIAEIDALKAELARVKTNGYALDNEEYARGIGCAAAPIFDHQGQAIAAIGVTGGIDHYTTGDDKRESIIQVVKDAAAEISEKLSGGSL